MRYRYYERWKVVLLVCLSCAAVAAISFAVWLYSCRFSIPAEEIERVAIFEISFHAQKARELTDPEDVAALCESVNALRVRRVLRPEAYFVDGGTSYLLLFHQKDGGARYLRTNDSHLITAFESWPGGGEPCFYAESGPDVARTFFERAQPIPASRMEAYFETGIVHPEGFVEE